MHLDLYQSTVDWIAWYLYSRTEEDISTILKTATKYNMEVGRSKRWVRKGLHVIGIVNKMKKDKAQVNFHENLVNINSRWSFKKGDKSVNSEMGVGRWVWSLLHLNI